MTPDCILCHMRRNLSNARPLGTDAQWSEFSKGLLDIYRNVPDGAPSIRMGPETEELYRTIYGITGDRYEDEKKFSNRFAMERLNQIRAAVESASDPVYAGLQHAILGNYIDFSALYGEVSFEKLEQLLAKAKEMDLDKAAYEKFRIDLEAAKSLLYITDNAGEIVFDRVCAEQIARRYPHVQITFCVRGGPTLNDATREDAAEVGIPFPVIDSGSTLAGILPEFLNAETKHALETADVIIAKGQANAETLLDSGYNIYFAFLVKCIIFEERFGKPKMTPMLVRERQ